MCYLPFARNSILPRRVQTVRIVVSSGLMTGFVISDRLATLILRNEAYGTAYKGVCPELNAVRYLAASQGNFNPNDKFDCMALSSM
jgi:hypothetical protein